MRYRQPYARLIPMADDGICEWLRTGHNAAKVNEREMKLWLVKPRPRLPYNDNPWWPWHDKAMGFVVRAATEYDARYIANGQSGTETQRIGNPWLDPKYSVCEELVPEGDSGVIIRDYVRA